MRKTKTNSNVTTEIGTLIGVLLVIQGFLGQSLSAVIAIVIGLYIIANNRRGV